ncbi:MAG: hypothetical protein ACM3XS_02115 [Bacteroidota bacterium]
MAEITKAAIKNGVVSAESNPELERNGKVQALWKHYDARQHKRRRVYLKELGTRPPGGPDARSASL